MDSASPPDTERLVGTTLGPGYRVVAKLASTGTSTVYRAWDHTADHYVVVKIPNADTLATTGVADRFDQEMASLREIFHPNLLPILDHGRHGDMPYAILPYLAGGSLRQRRPAKNGMPVTAHPALLHRWLIPVADALDHTHSCHFVHQNVSPDNILCDGSGKPFLDECGVAEVVRWAAATKTAARGEHGKPPLGAADCVAPELVAGSAASPHSDQYALAAVVYEFLTTRPPFPGLSPLATLAAHIHETVPPIRELSPQLPASLCDAVHRALAKTPHRRFPSCRAFAEHALAQVQPLETAQKLLLLCPSCHALVLVDPASSGKDGNCRACSAPVFVSPDLQSLVRPADRAVQIETPPPARWTSRRLAAGAGIAATALLLTWAGRPDLFQPADESGRRPGLPWNAAPRQPHDQPQAAVGELAPRPIVPGEITAEDAEAMAAKDDPEPAEGDAEADAPSAPASDPAPAPMAGKAAGDKAGPAEGQPDDRPAAPPGVAAPPIKRPVVLRPEEIAALQLQTDLATMHDLRSRLVEQKRSSLETIAELKRQETLLKNQVVETPQLINQQQVLLDIAIANQFAQQSLPPTRPNIEQLNALTARVKDIQTEINRLKIRLIEIPGELEVITSRIGRERASLQEVVESGENLRRQWLTRINPMQRDALLQEKIDALSDEIIRSPDFHECLLYRAMLFILAGKPVEAIADLDHAEDLLADDGQITTPPIAIDFVYASLMAGQGPRARRYLRTAEQRWPNDPVIQHIQALCEMNENSYSTAADLFRKALRKGRSSNRAQLCGDAAWLFAAAPADGIRNEKLARANVDEALAATGERSWTAWRALSVLNADAGDWGAAEDCLLRATENSPLVLAGELEDQLAGYRAGKTFRIARTPTR